MTHLEQVTVPKRLPAIRRRVHKENALGLLISCIQERRSLTEREHKAVFRKMILEEGYEDFLEALVDEWLGIKYTTALRAATPVSIGELRANIAKRSRERKRADEQVVSAKSIMGARFLELVMPNGKALRDCTGEQCTKFGGFYARIGKKVGATQLVGRVLTADDVADIFRSKLPT